MSQPPDHYERIFDFTDFSAMQPSAQQPGQKIDQELDAARESLNDTIDRLAEIQRDDGKLRADALDTTEFDEILDDATASVLAASASATASAATATTKAAEASASATSAGNSASAATGFAASAQAQALIASSSATTATTKATEAGNSAASALASQTSATASAGTATTKASEAFNSASAAATSAGNAATSAISAGAQANLAAAHATAASNSASTASAQATAAGNSASAAAASAVSAAASAAGIVALDPVEEAPTDGNEYVRKNAAWEIATGGDLSAKRDLTDYDFTNVPDEKLETFGLTLEPPIGAAHNSILDYQSLTLESDTSNGGSVVGTYGYSYLTTSSIYNVTQTWTEEDGNLITLGPLGFTLSQAGLTFNGTTSPASDTVQYLRNGIIFGNNSTQTTAFPGFNNVALTGTPTAPNVSAGDSSSKVANTAFVAGAIPAFATNAQAATGVSTTTVVSPASVNYAMTSPSFFRLTGMTAPGGVIQSGSGAVAQVNINAYRAQAPTSAVGYGIVSWGNTFHSRGSGSTVLAPLPWNRSFFLQFRYNPRTLGTDQNTVNRVCFGKALGPQLGDITNRGVAMKQVANGPLLLQVHNGTTLTTVTSTLTPVTTSSYDIRIVSDGTGNVTMFSNDIQIATTSAGPSTASGTASVLAIESENLAAITGTSNGQYVSEITFSFSIA